MLDRFSLIAGTHQINQKEDEIAHHDHDTPLSITFKEYSKIEWSNGAYYNIAVH